MDEHALFLAPVQYRAILARVLRFLRRRPDRRRRRVRLSVSAILRLTLLALRHNLTQRLLAALFRIGQSTACRAIAWMRGLLAEVLAPEIARAGDGAAALERLLAEAGGGPAIVLVDGTLVPVADRSWDPLNYSGKHRRKGRSIQVLADAAGRLLHVGLPHAGRTHDARALAESGLLAALRADERLLTHGDRGYRGLGLITPHVRPPGGELTLEQRVENREISAIRNAVERAIAHLKVLQVLRTGIRTRFRDPERVISEVIAVCVGLAFYRQEASFRAA